MKVHLVDGTFELFRAFFGAPPAHDAAGRPVGAIRGLLATLMALLREPDVTHVACAFDHVIESFRNEPPATMRVDRRTALVLPTLSPAPRRAPTWATTPHRSSVSSPPLDRTFDLRVGASMQAEGTDLEVRFEGVPSDSRCPPDVKCVSAGDATVALRLTGGGKATTTYELHTPRGTKDAEHGSYVVSLVALRPAPASNRQASAEDYVATVRVRRRD